MRAVLAIGAVVAAAVLATAGPAAAQSAFLFGEEGVRLVGQSQAELRATGELTVRFRSDPATCAAVGRCGLEGIVTHRPGSRGTLATIETRDRRGRRGFEAFLSLGDRFRDDDDVPDETGSAVRVRRTTPAGGARICVDRVPGGEAVTARAGSGTTTFALGGDGADPLATACATPLAEDALVGLPAATLTRAQTVAGGARLDLRGERDFTAGGFTGTASSTIVVRVGRPRRELRGTPVPATRTRGVRFLTVTHRIRALRGAVRETATGSTDPARCTPLDACGSVGERTVTPVLRSGELTVIASAPARVPARRLRAAVGLASGSTRGVEVGAFGDLDVAATVTTSVTLEGADAPCTDRRAFRDRGSLVLPEAVRGGGVELYGPGLGAGGSAARTRCPGPLPPLDGGERLRAEPLPRSALAAPRSVLRFATPRSTERDGRTIVTRPDLTLTLERVQVRERIERIPTDSR